MANPVDLELLRDGVGLVAENGGDSAIYLARVPDASGPLRSCTCAASRKRTCAHLKTLSEGLGELRRLHGRRSWEEVFSASVWHRLARALFEGSQERAADVRVQQLGAGRSSSIRISDARDRELARYLDSSPARVRLLERTGKVPAGEGYADRAALLDRLALFQTTREERLFAKAGVRSRRQAWEESWWCRLAYHCVREFRLDSDPAGGSFHPAVDEATGAFTLTWRKPPGGLDSPAVVRVTVPPERVEAALGLLAGAYPEQEDLALRPLPLRTLFVVRPDTEVDDGGVEVHPALELLRETGEARYLEQPDFERFRYGRLVYVRELGVLAQLEEPEEQRRFRAPARLRLRPSQVPSFLEDNREALAEGTLVLDEPLRDLRIFRGFDHVELAPPQTAEPSPAERGWRWLSVRYGFGSQTISLADLLRARREGMPYLETSEGWVDLRSPALRDLDDLSSRLGEASNDGPEDGGPTDRGALLRLTAGDLLRLKASTDRPVRVDGEGLDAAALERLLELRPITPFRQPPALASPLRTYQERGVDWLRFLWDNDLAGLLCDDMGLGKTHQAMALMAGLVGEGQPGGPFLVVCPTTVLPHWRAKIRDHAPGLSASVYHGTARELPAKPRPEQVVLTSYGVLRRDVEKLSRLAFPLVVFDEIQHLKNRSTQAYRAAAALPAGVKLGLTGTPIENSLGDLKALFDLLLPGYLGSDADFEERWGKAADGGEVDGEGLAELRRLISPFVLRRTKAAVLDELPEKIEDTLTCSLSEDQVKLYRDAIRTRGSELARRIARSEEPLPYIHVFALLNVLKRICDHPALALGELDRAAAYGSGKWDLYREILGECLDSGQKVVVFTQYLGMIELMESHLRELGVEFATLTGASGGSARRGALVDRFNTDPRCRVFLGSLKAGGTGIDLVGGSVVIHYDRWWNAAREDQATDRVHRIGQKRAVQVIRLVTEGTLEEKIDAIIDEKRRLAASVVVEDDPRLAKMFTRGELLELLRQV